VSKSSIGKRGEDQAADFLTDNGFQIIARNYHAPFGEVDIICLEDDVLVFVEVKAWSTFSAEQLEYGINKRKQKKIIETAKYFLSKHREYISMSIRFDVIFIGVEGIRRFSSAFMEDLG
jgi:putative endonuclease